MSSGLVERARGEAIAWICVFAVAGMAAHAAKAADLGGDCCADLEARIAELETTAARKGNRKVSLTISGQVNVNVLWWSEGNASGLDPKFPDDTHSDLYFGNAATDNRDPRIILSGEGRLSADLIAGFTMQIDNKFTDTDTQSSHQGAAGLVMDTTYVFLRSKSFGELRLGNMASASDDAYYLNFGAGTVGGLSGANHTGSFFLRDAKGNLTDTSYGSVLGEMSDNNAERLMYVSPTLAGFTVKADIGGGDTASTSLTWIGKVGSIEMEAGAGYLIAHSVDGDCASKGQQCTQGTDTISLANPWTTAAQDNLRALGLSGSIWDLNTGFYLSGEWSEIYADTAGRDNPANWFVQGGWTKNANGLGRTTIYGSYDSTTAKMANGTAAHYWNIGIDQAIDSVASNVYLHYQHDSFDTSGVVADTLGNSIDAQSIDSVTGGMVVHF